MWATRAGRSGSRWNCGLPAGVASVETFPRGEREGQRTVPLFRTVADEGATHRARRTTRCTGPGLALLAPAGERGR
jgi:hypothetical protein